jgi:hypothetical protein
LSQVSAANAGTIGTEQRIGKLLGRLVFRHSTSDDD